jgi:predicted nucleotide-binding protein
MNRQVVSLIRELGIDPIVMQDKTNLKKTLAQFLMEHQDITFVIAILSADDWAYPKNSKPKDALLYATQQVVFHLGYWIGKLGRERVFALYYNQRSFRWPTEHFDVIYTPLDDHDSWKKELIRRLKGSGIEIHDQMQ